MCRKGWKRFVSENLDSSRAHHDPAWGAILGLPVFDGVTFRLLLGVQPFQTRQYVARPERSSTFPARKRSTRNRPHHGVVGAQRERRNVKFDSPFSFADDFSSRAH